MTGPTPKAPSRGDAFHLLRNERRRLLLRYLRDRDPPVEVGEAATRIAAWEADDPLPAVPSDHRKRVYTALQQTHLPAMDELGVVEYDHDRGTVAPTEHAETVAVYLEVVPRSEFPWQEYYLALGAVACGLAAALWADVAVLSAVDDRVWTTVLAVVLAVSGTIHVYTGRRLDLEASGPLPEE